MAGFHVLGRVGFGVSTLGSCAGGCSGDWGKAVLKMDAICLRAVF